MVDKAVSGRQSKYIKFCVLKLKYLKIKRKNMLDKAVSGRQI